MARTRQEIQDEIITELKSKLPKLNNQSATAIWRLWVYVVSMSIWTFEKILDVFKQDIEKILEENKFGTLNWYSVKAKDFQYNHDLKINKYGETYYETEDDSSKVVAVASTSFDENLGTLLIKVAKDNNGNLEPLNNDQESKLNEYLERVKIVGTKITIINQSADKFKFSVDITASPLVNEEELKENLNHRIKEFLKVLPFDGKLSLNDFRDIVRGTENVEEVYINSASIFEGTNEVKFIKGVYTSRSGYIILDDKININVV